MFIAPLLYDAHVHTPLCGHALGPPESYLWQAWRRHLRGMYFTCHNPMPDGFSPRTRMAGTDWPAYLELVRHLRQLFAELVDLRLGLECDFLPEYRDFLRAQTASAPLDYVLGAVHPAFPEYQRRYPSANARDAQVQYFEVLAQAAETRLFDALAHPDQIKYLTWQHWSVAELLDPIRRCLDRVAAAGTALEVNTAGLQKTPAEANPGPLILREALARNIPVVLGSDAHQPERLGDNFATVLAELADLGFRELTVFVQRRAVKIPIATARASLAGLAAPGATPQA